MKPTASPPRMPPRPFSWPWTGSPLVNTLSPVRGMQYHLPGGHRVFFLNHDEQFDRIPWGGLALMRADKSVGEEAAPRMAALYLLHRMRHSLQEYRKPLRGLRFHYRKGDHHPAFNRFLGENAWQAIERLYGDANRTDGYDVRDFQRRLGKHLRGISECDERGPLPIGVSAVFRVPRYDAKRAAKVDRIVMRMTEQVSRWHAGKRRPLDLDKWLARTRSEPRRSVLHADREDFVCAVAFATWMAQACWYPYALADFAERIDPPLNPAEELIFGWYHWSRDLLGIPLQCVRRDYWDLVKPVVQDVLGRHIGTVRARREIHRVLKVHGWLVSDAQDLDNEEHKGKREREALKPYAEDLATLDDPGQDSGSSGSVT